ncbi:CAP domain-containing protein [Pirellulaceae bacterium SH449]
MRISISALVIFVTVHGFALPSTSEAGGWRRGGRIFTRPAPATRVVTMPSVAQASAVTVPSATVSSVSNVVSTPDQSSKAVIASPASVALAGSGTGSVTVTEATSARVIVPEAEVNEALAEVNAARARRGLRPFIHDPLLTQAAQQCAQIRASRRIAGHLPNDFAYLPAGSTARSAGCGAMESSWGWGTCCTYENYTYAGAAWVMGNDGKRYMHLFVR